MDGIGPMLYEGKAKKIFAGPRPDQVVQYFKDDATAFNAEKRGTIVEKGGPELALELERSGYAKWGKDEDKEAA